MAVQYIADGHPLTLGVPFILDGFAYPGNWLELASDADLSARGISKEPVAEAPEPTPEEAKALLALYADYKHARLVDGGVTVNGVFIETNDRGKIMLDGAKSLAQLVPDHVFDWIVSDTEVIQIAAADMIATAIAVGLWMQSTYSFLGSVLAQISSGSITTTAEIDGLMWPSNVITS